MLYSLQKSMNYLSDFLLSCKCESGYGETLEKATKSSGTKKRKPRNAPVQATGASLGSSRGEYLDGRSSVSASEEETMPKDVSKPLPFQAPKDMTPIKLNRLKAASAIITSNKGLSTKSSSVVLGKGKVDHPDHAEITRGHALSGFNDYMRSLSYDWSGLSKLFFEKLDHEGTKLREAIRGQASTDENWVPMNEHANASGRQHLTRGDLVLFRDEQIRSGEEPIEHVTGKFLAEMATPRSFGEHRVEGRNVVTDVIGLLDPVHGGKIQDNREAISAIKAYILSGITDQTGYDPRKGMQILKTAKTNDKLKTEMESATPDAFGPDTSPEKEKEMHHPVDLGHLRTQFFEKIQGRKYHDRDEIIPGSGNAHLAVPLGFHDDLSAYYGAYRKKVAESSQDDALMENVTGRFEPGKRIGDKVIMLAGSNALGLPLRQTLGMDPGDTRDAVELAQRFPGQEAASSIDALFRAYGFIKPEDANSISPKKLAELQGKMKDMSQAISRKFKESGAFSTPIDLDDWSIQGHSLMSHPLIQERVAKLNERETTEQLTGKGGKVDPNKLTTNKFISNWTKV